MNNTSSSFLQPLNGIQITTILISVLLFSMSLPMTAFFIDQGDWGDSGLMLFLTGWSAFAGGGFAEGLVWLANPFYLVALLFVFMGKKSAYIPSAVAVILALWFASWHRILTSESGATTEITSLGGGYVLWVSAMIVLSAGLLINEIRDNMPEKE